MNLEDFKLISLDLTALIDPLEVWIEIFHADREFTIPGQLIEGFLYNDQVLETDKICLRYNWQMIDYIDVEVYGKYRQAWYRLTLSQFAQIRNYIAEIQ